MSKIKEVEVDSTDFMFSKIMKICTLIGLVILIICGVMYLAGINPYLDTSSVVKHWEKPAGQFWKDIKNIKINDYSWFLFNLNHTDSFAMIGISLLSLTPLVSIIFILPKSGKVYTVLLLILIAEYIFSIIRPFIW